MARRRRDPDRKKAKKPKKPHAPPPAPGPAPAPAPAGPGGTANEALQATSTQSSQDAMNATPSSMAEANGVTDAAVYSTGPGAVVAYDYQRTGTYADEYAAQQAVDISGNPVTGGAANNPT